MIVEQAFTQEDAFVAAMKAELRARGFFVRYTEWPTGHQVVLHSRADTSRALVTGWHVTEVEAWREALQLASRAVPAGEPSPAQ